MNHKQYRVGEHSTNNNRVDCLLIGHNDQSNDSVAKTVGQTGVSPFLFREFESSYLWYKKQRYSLIDLINKWYCEPNQILPLSMGNHFSAAIAYLGTFLSRRGFTFDFINSFQDEKDDLADKLLKQDFLAIAITSTLYMSPEPICEIVQFIKKYNRTAKIVVGGPYIYYEARSSLAEKFQDLCELLGADIVVVSNQGETTLVNILTAIKHNLSERNVSNIWYRKQNSYEKTSIKPENNVLEYNMVNWGLFDGRLSEYVHVRTSKGCPYSCAFCDYPEFAGGPPQYAPVNAIEQELNTLPKIEPLHVELIDDTCNVPPTRFKEMLRMFLRNNYHFHWSCQLRCQFVDDEMATLMYESGCTSVFLGLESGNDRVLRNMNKNVTVADLQKGIDILVKHDIPTTGSFVIGFPGETDQTVADTINFINNSGIDFYRLQPWIYSDFAPIATEKQKYDLKVTDIYEWEHKTMNSHTAIVKQEEIAMSVDKRVVNLYDKRQTEFTIIPLLMHRGMNLQQIKDVLSVFNVGIEEKLLHPEMKEVRHSLIEQFVACCNRALTIDSNS